MEVDVLIQMSRKTFMRQCREQPDSFITIFLIDVDGVFCQLIQWGSQIKCRGEIIFHGSIDIFDCYIAIREGRKVGSDRLLQRSQHFFGRLCGEIESFWLISEIRVIFQQF